MVDHWQLIGFSEKVLGTTYSVPLWSTPRIRVFFTKRLRLPENTGRNPANACQKHPTADSLSQRPQTRN